MANARDTSDFDLVVVGSGIAGLYAALRAHEESARVLVVTKGSIDEASTKYAQGGIAAAVGPGDTADDHWRDTVEAGAGLVDEDAARILTDEAAARIADLVRFGVRFDATNGEVSLGKEAAHSASRILHAGGDSTGLEIELSLSSLARREGVTILEHTLADRLVVEGGRASGVEVIDTQANERRRYGAGAIVLATGGAGQLYRTTTNPAISTGDGVELAYAAGAEVDRDGVHAVPPDRAAAAGLPRLPDLRGRPGRGRTAVQHARRALHASIRRARRTGSARYRRSRCPPRDAGDRQRPRAARHHRAGRGVARGTVPSDLPHVPRSRPRHEPRPHPGLTRRALRDGGRAHEHLGRDDPARPVRRRRGGEHGRPRREPPREQLAPRDDRLRARARWSGCSRPPVPPNPRPRGAPMRSRCLLRVARRASQPSRPCAS